MSDPKRKRDIWDGLDAVDIETQETAPDAEADVWAGLAAEDAPAPAAAAAPDEQAERAEYERLRAKFGDAPAAPVAEDKPWYESLLSEGIRLDPQTMNELPGRALSAANEWSEDLLRGLAQGVTWRAGDEVSAAGNPERLERFRADNAASKERSPWLYAAGEAFGSVAPGLLSGPAAGLAARGLGSRVAAGALAGGAQGALTGAASGGENDTAEDMAWRALAGGAVGAATGGAVPVGAAGVQKLSEVAGPLARRAQAAAMGASGPAYRNIAESHGMEFAEDALPQLAERELPHRLPWTARDYAEAAGPLAQRTGRAVGEVVDEATEQIPQAVPTSDFLADLGRVRGQYTGNTATPARTGERTIGQLQRNVAAQVGDEPYLDPSQLHKLKTDWEGVGWPTDATAGMPSGRVQIAHQQASAVPRDALRTAILGNAEQPGLALPETQARFANAFEDHAAAATLRDVANRRAIEQGAKSQNLLSPSGLARAVGGNYVPDATAIGLRGVGQAARVGAQVGGAMANSPNSVGGALGGRVAGSFMDGGQGQQAQQQSRERVTDAGRGYLLEQAAEQALETNPQALGPFARQFMEARDSGDSRAISSLLDRLKTDERWRTQYLPQLQQQTAERQGGY